MRKELIEKLPAAILKRLSDIGRKVKSTYSIQLKDGSGIEEVETTTDRENSLQLAKMIRLTEFQSVEVWEQTEQSNELIHKIS